MSATQAAAQAFRRDFVISAYSEYNKYEARKMRYAILHALFENTAYDTAHKWAVKYKTDYGLYRFARNIYNPAYRIATMYRSYVYAGALDPEAGDGATAPSCMPIVTDRKDVRTALATLWKASNWQINKGIIPQMGAALGDVGAMVVDDVERKKVYLQRLSPGDLKTVSLDPFGNVKAYEISREIVDENGQKYQYGETARRGNGQDVIYTTYKDEREYAYGGDGAFSWTEPYGFIPLVLIKHNDVGMEWGWSEIHPALSKIREVDDLASKVSDQVRKMVDAPWLFTGTTKQDTTASSQAADGQPPDQRERQNVPVLYAKDPNARATPLVANLDIPAALQHITGIIEELEREYPELQMDIWNTASDPSGTALDKARQRVESKILERRVAYDDGIKRVMQMAVSIGGFRQYEGYKGFNLESYAKGDLDFRIGDRPVFKLTTREKLEIAQMKKTIGVPDEQLQQEVDYTEDQIRAWENLPSVQAKRAISQMGLGAVGK